VSYKLTVAVALCALAWGLTSPGCSTPPKEMSPAEFVDSNSTLIEDLKSYDAKERNRGVATVKKLGKEQGTNLILYILTDPRLDDYRLEVVLARLLADWKDARAVPYLLKTLNIPDDGAVRIASEGLIVFGDDPNVTEALTEKLASPVVRDRRIAAEILCEIRTQQSFELLGASLKGEKDPEVRAQMLVGIIQGRHAKRKEYLVDALSDPDQAMRELAWNALRRYQDLPRVGYNPRGPAAERNKAIEALHAWLKGR